MLWHRAPYRSREHMNLPSTPDRLRTNKDAEHQLAALGGSAAVQMHPISFRCLQPLEQGSALHAMLFSVDSMLAFL